MHRYYIKYKNIHDVTCSQIICASSAEEGKLRLVDCKEVIKISDRGAVLEVPASAYRFIHSLQLSHRELADILRQLAYSDKAGIPIHLCLNIMASTGSTKQIIFCNKVVSYMNQGDSLADAIEKVEYMLPEQISPIIRASIMSDSLYSTISALSAQIETNISISGKIRTALIYPTLVLFIAACVTWFLFTTIIPQVAEVIEGIGNSQLPALTRAIIALGEFLSKNGVLILIVLAGGIAAIAYLLSHGKSTLQSKLVLYSPYVGKIVYTSEMAKFYGQFAFLLNAGFATDSALASAISVVGSSYIRKQLNFAYDVLIKGYSFVEAMRASKLVSSLDIQLLQTGSVSGELPSMCTAISEQLSDEAERRMQMMLKIVEPAIMIIVGAIVGVVMIAIYQPLFEMMTVF